MMSWNKNKFLFLLAPLIILLGFQNCSEMKASKGNFAVSSSLSTQDFEEPLVSKTSVPVFMAGGHLQSSMVSCDGGQSWRGYQSSQPRKRCWDSFDYIDCDFHEESVTGLTYGPGGFILTFGASTPGVVTQTTNGRDFIEIDSGNTWSGVAYGSGTYVLNARVPKLFSWDLLKEQKGGDLDFLPFNARGISYVDQGDGFFVSQARSGGVVDLMISRDQGESWQRPSTIPSSCVDGEIAFNQEMVALLGADLCLSTDQGKSWEIVEDAPKASQVFYANNRFVMYSDSSPGSVYTSSDGLKWETAKRKLAGKDAEFDLGLIGHDTGTQRFVAIAQGWDQLYEKTEYYMSDDGIDWQKLDTSVASVPTAPHPMRFVTSGFMEQEDCEAMGFAF